MTDTNKNESTPKVAVNATPTETATPVATSTPKETVKPQETQATKPQEEQSPLFELCLHSKPCVAKYKSESKSCGHMNRFKSVSITITSEDKKYVFKKTYTKFQGKPVFPVLEPGEYTVEISEEWTDYKTVCPKNYGKQKFTVK